MNYQKAAFLNLNYHPINPLKIDKRENSFNSLIEPFQLIIPNSIQNKEFFSINREGISKKQKNAVICNNINIAINNSLPPKNEFEKKIEKENSKKFDKKSNKYLVDNILRKIKSTLLSCLINFINTKIYQVYNGKINKGILKKELKYFNQRNISKIEDKKAFIYKNLKDIFSIDINGKYSNFIKGHNRIIVNGLLNEKEDEKRKIFEKLLSLNFLDCLSHFIGKNFIKELEGLKLLNEILKDFEKDRDYIDLVKKCAFDFEKIILRKKSRNRKKNIKKEE